MVTRIRQLLDTKQLTPTQFADFIGVGRPVMSHILSERNKPSLEVVQRIISAFPEVSLHWLLSGLGEMLGEASSAAPAAHPVTEEVYTAPSPLASTVVPTQEPVLASDPAEPVAEEETQPASIAETPASTPTGPPALPAPAQVLPAAAQALSIAPQLFAVGPSPLLTGVIAENIPAAVPVAPAAPVVMKPFRAARFVPAVAVVAKAPVAALRKPAETHLPVPEISTVRPASTPAPPLLAAADVPAASPSMPTARTQLPGAAMLPFLEESGKEIKRIVIFYRDGSFADYQPEA